MERDRTETDAEAAEQALAAMTETRRRMAARAQWSLARHAAVGLLLGMMVASYALPIIWTFGAAALAMAATLALVIGDRRRDGFFVNGYRPGRTRRIAILLAAVAVGGLGLALVGKHRLGLDWMPLAAGLVLTVVGTLASLAWERAYRADLEQKR